MVGRRRVAGLLERTGSVTPASWVFPAPPAGIPPASPRVVSRLGAWLRRAAPTRHLPGSPSAFVHIGLDPTLDLLPALWQGGTLVLMPVAPFCPPRQQTRAFPTQVGTAASRRLQGPWCAGHYVRGAWSLRRRCAHRGGRGPSFCEQDERRLESGVAALSGRACGARVTREGSSYKAAEPTWACSRRPSPNRCWFAVMR